MADITISLPDDRMLSIDSIEVSEFLNVWDALMGSRVINSLLDEKIGADNEEISSKKLKGLVQEGLLAVGIFIEEDVKDGDLTAEINKMFDVDISPFSIVTLNEVTDKFMKGVNQLDATAAAYFAAKIAAMFVWEQMKDNYIIGLRKGNEKHD